MRTLEQYLQEGTCAATVVRESVDELQANGFAELSLSEPWELQQGGSYYVKVRNSSLIAFRVGDTSNLGNIPFFRIVSAHTDQPAFKLKSAPEIKQGESGKLNISVYGGPIYYSWMDRPLSLAGQVVVKGENAFAAKTYVVDLKKPYLVIPSLAIHMSRDVNKGVELNPQVDLQPLAGLNLESNWLRDLLVSYLKDTEGLDITSDDILQFELYTYNADAPVRTGIHEEFLSSPRIDDLCMAKAGLDAMIRVQNQKGITVLALLDNEEIGSRTPQGGESLMTNFVLEKIADTYGLSHSQFADKLTESFMISGDVAHAIHPNHPEKHDSFIHPVLGGGIVIKEDAGQRYMTNAADESVLIHLCQEYKVPYQFFISRADARSGSTLGPIMCANLPCHIVDVGTPMLSMHSARELMAVQDFDATCGLFEAFFKD